MRQILLSLSIVATASLAHSPISHAEDTGVPSSDQPVRIARLIKELGAPAYLRRQSAENDLENLGQVTRAQLEKVIDSDDPELRLRARRLLKKIKLENLWQGSTVSLVAEELKASEAVIAISDQTGNDLAIGDQYASFNDVAISLQHPESLFWQAVDDVCRKSHNRVRSRYGDNPSGLVFASGQIGLYPVAYAGPVRAQLTSAKRIFVEDFDYEDRSSDTTHTFQINMVMTWEDKFRLVAHQSHLTVGSATANEPIRIIDHRPAESGWQVVSGGARQYSTALRIQPPPQSAHRLTQLTLNWDMIAVGDMDTLVIDDLSPGLVHRKGDIGAIVNSSHGSDTRWQLTLAVSRDLIIPKPSEVLFVENKFELYDDQQRAFTHLSSSRLGVTQGAARMKLVFEAPADNSVPTRLVIRYPRIRDRRNLAITFHDVPLPSAVPE
ncbi:MAG: hypothetical protein N2C12_15875 [Planctomycetales bacterium]